MATEKRITLSDLKGHDNFVEMRTPLFVPETAEQSSVPEVGFGYRKYL